MIRVVLLGMTRVLLLCIDKLTKEYFYIFSSSYYNVRRY